MSEKNGNAQSKSNGLVRNFIDMTKWGIDHMNIIKTYQQIDKVKNQLGLANMYLARLDQQASTTIRRMEEFDHAMILLTRGKWAASNAVETDDKQDWKQASEMLKVSEAFAQELYDRILSGSSDPIPFEKVTLSNKGTEITYADDTPLLPSISPVVILQGSDYEMGYQYAQQLVQIFGSWILERKAGRAFSEEELSIIKRWEEQIQQHAPEMLGLCEGWAAGATDAGVPMSYYDVLELWTGHAEPLDGYFGESGMPEMGMPWCSGAAAWGRATADGELVTASSGDHDPGFTVTVIALPETGNNFMFCPFGATGDVPKAGALQMFGHPGMNDQGVVYVHHGGGPKWAEPKEHWGYGIRRAVSVFHVLRFASSAREALDMEMAMPIGDIGQGDPGHPGGFYADSDYGYVIESRKDPVIIREAGVMGETDFLYAANAPLHPDISQVPWRQDNQELWSYDEHGGWYPSTAMSKINFQTILFSLKQPHVIGVQFAALNSRLRNRYMFKTMNQALGHIDFDTMTMMFRQIVPVLDGTMKELRTAYDNDQWGDVSCGNATNALVVVTKPSEKMFAHCVGAARRGMSPMSPKTFSNPIYDETNAFWELKLEATPEAITQYSRQRAEDFIQQAHTLLAGVETSGPSTDRLNHLLERAVQEIDAGLAHEASLQSRDPGEAVLVWAQATRAYTRAQVRARQVINTLTPPPFSREDLVQRSRPEMVR